ncbi:hypothetical protein QCA50_007469 [Cerrena zonata]|uniref:Argonaute-like protein n=1 Tax=Cerrena zonata TaxID=2478898 RepID=A0AAW0GE69_9APHY
MSDRGRGGPRGRGRGEGGGPPPQRGRGIGGPAPRGRGAHLLGTPAQGGPGIPSNHVTAVGVKRSAFGTAGRAIQVITNHFEVKIPQGLIYHYDAITPDKLPARANMELLVRLQEVLEPGIFTPRGVYDGRKNLFSIRRYPFENDTRTFDVTLGNTPAQDSPGNAQKPKKGPKGYKVKLTKVAEINPELLSQFTLGNQSHAEEILTTITALNIVVRMEPTIRYPFNVRSFFTKDERQDIGGGLELWRGYFQSVRPAIGKMVINLDISTGVMYRAGPLIELCLQFLGKDKAAVLSPTQGFPERERLRLQRFVSGLRITSPFGPQAGRPRGIRKLTAAGASALSFTPRDGPATTVARFFQQTYNRQVRYPNIVCAELASGAIIPLEFCDVVEGQIMRKQFPQEKTDAMVKFSTKKPADRLNSIMKGLGVLSYGQSEYIRAFGLDVATQNPLVVNARVLDPPRMLYRGPQASVMPRDGAWNMIQKKFYQPSSVKGWVVVIYEPRFNDQAAQSMVQGLVQTCGETGVVFQDQQPPIIRQNGQGNIGDQLKQAGTALYRNKGYPPDLIVAVLPQGSADIYQAIKHFGDVTQGVATQCLSSQKCSRANQQYYANVALKINVKLGGINTVPDPRSVSILTDPSNPTIVMGADEIHPAPGPGSDTKPSFTAVVASVDSDSAKYIADCQVQTGRRQMIDDLKGMTKALLGKYMGYRKNVEKKANNRPKRLLFFRDGVSEGQFQQVLDLELPLIKEACVELEVDPKITIIVVGKRHHVRFFPRSGADADRSTNCRAGTVVDRDITSPLENDFFLQSHAGIIGTSRPAHYNVLYDENNFTPDGLQSLSFALCHVYARSTRSVSIPAPVYYADIVCSRAKNHYQPGTNLDLSDTGTVDNATERLQQYKDNFKPLHQKMQQLMYFS